MNANLFLFLRTLESYKSGYPLVLSGLTFEKRTIQMDYRSTSGDFDIGLGDSSSREGGRPPREARDATIY